MVFVFNLPKNRKTVYPKNFGFSRKDTRENVLENFKIICRTIEVDFEKLENLLERRKPTDGRA